MLPQVNCTVTKVTDRGGAEDWDQPSGAGSIVWQGTADGYYRVTRERTEGTTTDLVTVETLIVNTNLREWAEGETVTFTVGEVERTGRIRLIEPSILPGHPLETTRLTFE